MALAAMALSVAVVYQFAGTRRDLRRYLAPGKLVPADTNERARLHLYQMGDSGPAVILDAGIGASSLSWRIVQTMAAQFARVYAYDRAGFGWSDAPRRAHGPRIASKLAEELRDTLHAAQVEGPYILVGHSFGGFVARMYAERWPAEVAGLMMVDSPTAADWAAPDEVHRRQHLGGALFSRVGGWLAWLGVVRFCLNRFSRGGRALPVTVTRAFGASALALVTRMVSQVMKFPEELRPIAQAQWSRPAPFLSLADHLQHLPVSAREVAECGSLGDLPFVVLTASNPTPQRAAAQDALACQSTRGRHIVAREGGHWLLLDQPELVVQVIRSVTGES